MYCSACGKEMNDKAVICVGCGVPVQSKPNIAKSVFILGYISTFAVPFLGLILGIYLIVKDKVGHGVLMILLSITFFSMWAAIISGSSSY